MAKSKDILGMGSDVTQSAREYPKEVMDAAIDYGFKTANLFFLKKLIEEENRNDPRLMAEVPEPKGIKSNDIIAHLDKHASNWRKLWEDFCLLQSSEATNILPTAEKKLEVSTLSRTVNVM